MINIYLPPCLIEERKYVVRFLFNSLGVSYQILFDKDIFDYRIESNEKCLIISDSFFGHIEDFCYLKKENIPSKIAWLKLPFRDDFKIPIIYGTSRLELKESSIYCGLDIFASSFFMLTRWEELFLPKDKFGRCDENKMFVVRYDIYNRPVVNEYIELLGELLQYIGVEVKGTDQKFHPFITHDVDDLFRFASLKNFCKNLVGDLLHRKSLKLFFQTCRNYVHFQFGKMKDPFDTFDELMDYSKRYGWKNAFYFMPSYSSEFDARYDIRDKKVKNIIDNIIIHGHEIGIHPSKNTFGNAGQFVDEVERLREIYPQIQGGRQHYLLYDLPYTLDQWETSNLEYDAGLGFSSRGGFRCGICYSYPFFDVLKRKELKLIIRPLIVMEVALFRNDVSSNQVKREIFDLIDIVKRYEGEFVLLWHTDNFYRGESLKYRELYFDVLKHIAK